MKHHVCLWLLAILVLPAWAACGPVPNTYGLYNGFATNMGNNAVINDGSDHPIAAGGYIGSGFRPNGTVVSTALSLPDITPSKPASFGSLTPSVNGGSWSAGTYSSATLSGTIALGAGDYFINNLTINASTVLTTSGTVRFFIGSGLSATGSNITINSGGSVGAFQLYIYDNVTAVQMGDNLTMTGLIYGGSAVSAVFGHQMTINGAMLFGTNSSIVTGNNLTINYSAAVQTAIGNISTCGPSATLLAEYRFDECGYSGASGQVTDRIGGANGTAINGLTTGSGTSITSTPTRTDPYGVFNRASNQDVVLPNNAAFKPDGSFTVSLWARVTGSTGTYRSPLTLRYVDGSGVKYGFNLYAGTDDKWQFWLGNGPSFQSFSGPAITLNTWTHIVARYQANSATAGVYSGSASLFVNNVKTTNASALGYLPIPSSVSTAALFIGAGGDTNGSAVGFGPFDGMIDEVKIFSGALSDSEVATIYTNETTGKNWDGSERTNASCLHHIDIYSSDTGSTGLTCSPSALTVRACLDAACSTLYTGGVTGTMTASGSPTVNWGSSGNFSIPAGSGSTTQSVQVTTPGSVTFGTTVTSSPTPTSSTVCSFNASCGYTSYASGFTVSVPHHAASSTVNATITALQSASGNNACVPAFTSAKTVNFSCAYVNPTSGSLGLKINNVARACNGGTNAVSLNFNSSGVATVPVSYDDAGRMSLTASYTGTTGTESGLVMGGTGLFVVAPAKFELTGFTAAPSTIVAGKSFNIASIRAVNGGGAVTANFGKENTAATVTLDLRKCTINGRNGTFTPGTLTAFLAGPGFASATGMSWDEVGSADVTATSSDYLGSSLNPTGSTNSVLLCNGNVGALTFIPDHFVTTVARPVCSNGTNVYTFAYSGQPFRVTVTAKNFASPSQIPQTTQNYDANAVAKDVTLSDRNASLGGSFKTSGNADKVLASAFSGGVGSNSGVTYSFNSKQNTGGPYNLVVRADDTDSVSSNTGKDDGTTPNEGSITIRSGRLKLSPQFGSPLLPLKPSVEVQYWNGSAWVLSADDSCTPKPTVTMTACTPPVTTVNQILASDISNAFTGNDANLGKFDLTFSNPNRKPGFFDVVLTPADAWLNDTWSTGSDCKSNAFDSKYPHARMRYGIYGNGVRNLIYQREVY